MALSVLGFLPEDAGDNGLMSVACIVAHLAQIVIDSAVLSKWHVTTPDDKEEPAAEPTADNQELLGQDGRPHTPPDDVPMPVRRVSVV